LARRLWEGARAKQKLNSEETRNRQIELQTLNKQGQLHAICGLLGQLQLSSGWKSLNSSTGWI
jgi:hypothetical protein